MRFPQHLENVKFQKCSDCGTIAPICGYWGERQEHRLCMKCDRIAWDKLLAITGRLAEWYRLTKGY